MTYDEVVTYLRDLVGSQDWVGFPVVIEVTPLTLGESKTWITNAKEFVRTLTLSKAQPEQLIDRDAVWEDQEWAWLSAYWWCLEMQKELEKKLWKPRSVYVTLDSSPARRQHTDHEPAESILEYFGPEPSEWSLRSHSSSDFDSQTDTDDNSDTSHQTATSNRDRHWDKAWWWDHKKGERGGWQKTNCGKLSLPIYQDSPCFWQILHSSPWHYPLRWLALWSGCSHTMRTLIKEDKDGSSGCLGG